MIKGILHQLEYAFSKLTFTRKKENGERLKKLFGDIKEESFDFERIEKYFEGIR